MSSNALLCVIRTMGYTGRQGMVFEDLHPLHEQGYMPDAIEIQLAQQVGNAVLVLIIMFSI